MFPSFSSSSCLSIKTKKSFIHMYEGKQTTYLFIHIFIHLAKRIIFCHSYLYHLSISMYNFYFVIFLPSRKLNQGTKHLIFFVILKQVVIILFLLFLIPFPPLPDPPKPTLPLTNPLKQKQANKTSIISSHLLKKNKNKIK